MTDSPYGAIYQAVERHRAELLRMERAAASEMVRAYGKVWARMQKRITKLARDAQAAAKVGSPIDPSWVTEYQRVNDLMAQIEGELRRLHAITYQSTIRTQSRAIEASQRHFRDVLAIAGDAYGAPDILSSWNRVPLDALRDMVGTMRRGSPLRTLLDGLGVVSSQQIRDELLAGLAAGEGPRAVARRIRGALGGDLSRALRISRTETMRAYRTATNEQYRSNDHIIDGWRWLASHSGRTCAACLALDGTWHPSTEVQQDHPNGRCTSVPALRGRDDPSAPAPWETGSEWLAKQSPEMQERILGKGSANAYRAGAITLDDLRGTATSPLWGRAPRVKGLAEVVGPEEAKRWVDLAMGKGEDTETPTE